MRPAVAVAVKARDASARDLPTAVGSNVCAQWEPPALTRLDAAANADMDGGEEAPAKVLRSPAASTPWQAAMMRL
jgi:hypothetical protein